MNEQLVREAMTELAREVRPVPGMANRVVRQARRRRHATRVAIASGAACALAGTMAVPGAVAGLQHTFFAPADGDGPANPPTPTSLPTGTPTPPEPTPTPTDTPTPPEPTPTPTDTPTPPEPTPTPTTTDTHTPPEPTPTTTDTHTPPEPTPTTTDTPTPPEPTPTPTHRAQR